MSSSKLAAVLLVLATPACAAVDAGCPPSLGAAGAVHLLADAQVFQGPPAEKVELAPVNGDWDLGEIAGTGGGKPFNLVCHYAKTKDVETVQVPAGVKACVLSGNEGRTVVSCR